jgi:hypothetical protein
MLDYAFAILVVRFELLRVFDAILQYLNDVVLSDLFETRSQLRAQHIFTKGTHCSFLALEFLQTLSIFEDVQLSQLDWLILI